MWTMADVESHANFQAHYWDLGKWACLPRQQCTGLYLYPLVMVRVAGSRPSELSPCTLWDSAVSSSGTGTTIDVSALETTLLSPKLH
jgi:hypothetical protein